MKKSTAADIEFHENKAREIANDSAACIARAVVMEDVADRCVESARCHTAAGYTALAASAMETASAAITAAAAYRRAAAMGR